MSGDNMEADVVSAYIKLIHSLIISMDSDAFPAIERTIPLDSQSTSWKEL